MNNLIDLILAEELKLRKTKGDEKCEGCRYFHAKQFYWERTLKCDWIGELIHTDLYESALEWKTTHTCDFYHEKYNPDLEEPTNDQEESEGG